MDSLRLYRRDSHHRSHGSGNLHSTVVSTAIEFHQCGAPQSIICEKNLSHANASFANLQEVNFQEANLQGAQLQGVDLLEAQLQGAQLQGANLQGANLTDVRNLTQAQLNTTCGDENTKLPTIPEGLTSPPLCPK